MGGRKEGALSGIVVIADDITGAAEIAGIASRHGLNTQLITHWHEPLPAACVTVIATDTRSESETEAVETMRNIGEFLLKLRTKNLELRTKNLELRTKSLELRTEREVKDVGADNCCTDEQLTTLSSKPSTLSSKFLVLSSKPSTLSSKLLVLSSKLLVFKKTDSVLRGHIMAETRALMGAMGYKRALLLPQNPSKERIIRNGIYYIKGVELSETDFRYDPEFPAYTSDVCKRLDGACSLAVDEEPVNSINIADATNGDEVCRQLSKADDSTLIVGAADCFEAMLGITGCNVNPPQPTTPHSTSTNVGATLVVARQEEKPRHKESDSIVGATLAVARQEDEKSSARSHAYPTTLIICGSTQSRSLKDEPYIKNMCAEEISMPADVFHGGDPTAWMERLKQSYAANGSLVMRIGLPSEGGKAYAVRLRNLMSEAAALLIDTCSPQRLIIEGGATAYALLMRMGWHSFAVTSEIAPGVVCMRRGGTDIILKPGSYAWGGLFG